MRKSMILVLLVLIVRGTIASDYFSNVTNLWFQGYHTNVLQIADMRLSSNTNDIAGLLMKASWNSVYGSVDEMSNSLMRVVSVGGSVLTPSFINEFAVFRIDALCTLEYLSVCTAEQREEDRSKGAVVGREIPYADELRALDEDGYFCADR